MFPGHTFFIADAHIDSHIQPGVIEILKRGRIVGVDWRELTIKEWIALILIPALVVMARRRIDHVPKAHRSWKRRLWPLFHLWGPDLSQETAVSRPRGSEKFTVRMTPGLGRLTRRTKHEHHRRPKQWRDIMTGFIREIAALISITSFIASIGVLSEVMHFVN